MSTSESGRSGAADKTLQLDRLIREKLVAVVVDANAYGPVGPDIARLTSLAADLVKLGIQTWVPEPVAWEWAEHLAAEWTTARTVVKKHLGQLVRAGLPPMVITPDYRDRGAIIEGFLQALAAVPHVEIVALTGENAVQGLKDQILRRPPAKTKTDDAVKTGGSDSAWLRDALDKAGAPDRLLFLSEDKDLKQAFGQWGHAEPLMRTPSTIRASLFEDVPATVDDQWLVASYLSSRVPIELEDAPALEGDLIGPSTVGLLDSLDLDWEEHGWTGGTLTKLTALAGLYDVVCEAPELHEPDKPPNVRTIRATAFFLADAETTHVYRFGDDEEPVSESTSPHSGLVVRTRLVLQVRGREVVGVRPDSDTTVFAESRFEESWDAMEEVDDVLTSVPGLVLPEDWGGWQYKGQQQITIAGTEEVADLLWGYGEHGGFVVIIGGDEATLTCEYDDEAWVGGSDGIHVYPPYYLTAETPGQVATGGAWALSAWMIQRLLEERR